MFASIQDLLGKREVSGSRRCDYHSIDVRIFQDYTMIVDRAAYWEIRFYERSARGTKIDDVLDSAVGQCRKIAQEIRTPVATTELREN
jgi:hypothetical protein